ncbi:MAG: TIGR02300 family protein [Afipia sp.]|nr:TIGR02300 family protein [Afipia sp.]
MAKADLGTKRICPTTGKKFYDLNKNPVISPYSGEIVPIAPVPPPRTRADAAARASAAAAAATAAAATPEPAEAEELVSLEEADAEENTGKVKAVLPESEDDIEVDETLDDDDDDSTFIPEEEEDDGACMACKRSAVRSRLAPPTFRKALNESRPRAASFLNADPTL